MAAAQGSCPPTRSSPRRSWRPWCGRSPGSAPTATGGCTWSRPTPTFEHENFDNLLYRHGYPEGQWSHHGICTTTLAAGATATPPPWSSSGLSAAVGVDRAAFGIAHTSSADTDWHRAVYDAVMAGPDVLEVDL